MFLNYNILGISDVSNSIPPKKEYNKTVLLGAAEFDNVHVLNYELDDETIKSISTEQTFTENTIFLANFENTLEAGNFTNNDVPITSWRIYRKKTNELLYKLLKEILKVPGSSFYIDYTAQSGVEYNYQVFPVSNGIEGNGTSGGGIMTFDYGWILSDQDEDIVYTFDIELETSDIQTLQDYKKYDNYSQFPSFSFGQKKYREGSLTTMPLTINSNNIDYETTVDTLNNLRDFINNKEQKILKNSKGEIFLCSTYDFSHKYLDKIGDLPFTISFKFTEIGTI